MRGATARRLAPVLGVALALLTPFAHDARAAGMDTTLTLAGGGGFPARVTLTPNLAHLGERVLYRARVLTYGRVQWLPPEPDSSFTWGAPREGYAPERRAARPGDRAARPPAPAGPVPADTSWIEIPFQVFRTGMVPVPGLRFQLLGRAPEGAVARTSSPLLRMPAATLVVVDLLTAADSARGLKDVHGPVPAPWWERVPWRWVAGALLLVAATVLLVRWLRRRRPAPVAPPRPLVRDPMAEALAALRALREEHLPETGRFAEHAYRLGQILRRYLEATTRFARPGDTTPELAAHVRTAGLANADVQRLLALLRLWDRVKFAREPFTVDEARRTEDAVEAFVRGREPVGAAGEPGRVA